MCKALAKDMRMFQIRIPSIASELLFGKGVLKTWGFQDSEFLFFTYELEGCRELPHQLHVMWPLSFQQWYIQEQTGSSNRPWLCRQTNPISSGITRNSGGDPCKKSKYSPPSIVKGPWSLPPFHSLSPCPRLCDVVPRSLLSPPLFPCPDYGVSVWPT